MDQPSIALSGAAVCGTIVVLHAGDPLDPVVALTTSFSGVDPALTIIFGGVRMTAAPGSAFNIPPGLFQTIAGIKDPVHHHVTHGNEIILTCMMECPPFHAPEKFHGL